MHKNIIQSLKIVTLALVISVGISYVSAWTAPTVTPPNGNASAPVNVGSIAQTKVGPFGVVNTANDYGLRVSGNPSGANWNKSSIYSADTSTGKTFSFGTRGNEFSISSETVPNNAQRFLIDHNSGNVAIGTSVTANKLEVAGNTNINGVLSSGKVQIIDVVTENTACSPNGLIARDSIGVLLSCQSAVWKKASGSGSGGTGMSGLLMPLAGKTISCYNGSTNAYAGFASVDTNGNPSARAICATGQDSGWIPGFTASVRCYPGGMNQMKAIATWNFNGWAGGASNLGVEDNAGNPACTANWPMI